MPASLRVPAPAGSPTPTPTPDLPPSSDVEIDDAAAVSEEEDDDEDEDEDEEVDQLEASSASEDEAAPEPQPPARPASPPVEFEPSEDEGERKGKAARTVRKPGETLIPYDALLAILDAERAYFATVRALSQAAHPTLPPEHGFAISKEAFHLMSVATVRVYLSLPVLSLNLTCLVGGLPQASGRRREPFCRHVPEAPHLLCRHGILDGAIPRAHVPPTSVPQPLSILVLA
jgi:hypothetical protein